MTIEQRLEQVEQQNQKIQRTNKRLTVALTMMAVVVCAVVTMAATGDKDGYFDTVTARHIYVRNDAHQFVVIPLGANDYGDGLVYTRSAKGKELVSLSATDNGGAVTTYQSNGKMLVGIGTTDTGGMINVSNKTGETIAEMGADEYGNGLVGAWNRKGKGRTLKPGP
ncbi:MAG: hypothetical protein ACJ0UT_07855 [Candidatus Latescibacterota bacterium]